MLLPNFYEITKQTESEENTFNFQIKLDSKHSVYNGHFPEQPILPGVCTVQIIKECAERITNTPLQYSQISTCKFLSSVNPILHNEINLSVSVVNNNDNSFALNANGIYMDNTFIKLKALVKTV